MGKAMKKKPISAKLARRHLFAGKIDKTKSGYSKTDFVKNKTGKIVSKKQSLRAKRSPWIAAVQKARAVLKIKGFLGYQEGHSTLHKGQRALWPVKKSEYQAQGTSSRCGDIYICG